MAAQKPTAVRAKDQARNSNAAPTNAGDVEAQRIIGQIQNMKLTADERDELHAGLLDFLTEDRNLPACYR